MRHSYILLLLALLAACAPSKPQFPMPTARDRVEAPSTAARQSDVRQAEPRPSSRANTRSAPAPSTPMSSAPTTSEPVPSEWVVTAIKGKFLAIDTTGVRVFLIVRTNQPNNQPMSVATFQERFIVNYVMYPDYNNRERLGYGNVPITPESMVREGDHLRLTFTINRPKNATNAILLTEISESATGKKALNDLPLRFKPAKLSDQFAVYDGAGQQPLLRNFAQTQDTIMIRDVNRTPQTLTVFRYKHEFDPALPPMSSSQRPAPRTLEVDTTMTVRTNEPIRLPGEGLYYFVADTNDVAGIGLVVTDARFPRMTRPERLIRPLLYMSTGTEMAELNSSKEVKKALDRYWLSLMSGSEDVAKKAIRAYYGRVEEANQLFTTYKEGWKTDKGMIYIILGAPDRVQRSRDREVWVYNRRNNQSEVNFTFNRKQNQFVDDHYELVRYEEYRPVWFPIVEAWRTGAIRD
ncbi:GWxTD domain-containing protein [Fibrella sp. HMF5335]|uniref:GWxTD domain-containing protein n=1 Tax=Fibrella rubiginis TaxID=2817060 RepID=A0A939GFF8_9BACT|nr:GWxTD domain-containing protein [Fibrella rubiginis]MBO0936515.1 GWxTD domain-containing protein [Fibrella rubiginis]